ncbi:MAG: pyrroline-5-carboxylate reductase [Candidatus Omnitrophota bacterium]|nr:MAG: pyrroline-5-carboxylate reductase [Candidatus Omnitrophota bacterium]
MRLGIIGCGNMGSALARGVLSKKILPFNNIYISDKDLHKIKELYKKFGIRVSANEELVKKCNFIIIAVKPQDSKILFRSISGELNNSKHLISIMAGVSISKIESLINKKIALTRAMPNMAALAGKSTTCLSHNKMVKDKAVVHSIFSSVGDVLEIDEKYMDAVTAVSGSGPAYFFYLAEALKEAAMKLGIKGEHALRLAAGTLIGSGALLDDLKLNPQVLRERITSKGGTTEAALRILKSKKFKNLVVEAIKAAARRSKRLSKCSTSSGFRPERSRGTKGA